MLKPLNMAHQCQEVGTTHGFRKLFSLFVGNTCNRAGYSERGSNYSTYILIYLSDLGLEELNIQQPYRNCFLVIPLICTYQAS